MTLEQLVRARNSIADRMCEIWLAAPKNPRAARAAKSRFSRLRAELLALDAQIAAAQRRRPGVAVEFGFAFAPNAMQNQGQN